MVVKHKHELAGTSRAMGTDKWQTTRLLLREDGVGLTVTDVTLGAGSEAIYGYKHHVEIGYCLEGEATITELATGVVHVIKPGSLFAAARGERFRWRSDQPTRLITIFNPALAGPEVNDADGSFPLL
jgi:L-ectoine synthase